MCPRCGMFWAFGCMCDPQLTDSHDEEQAYTPEDDE